MILVLVLQSVLKVRYVASSEKFSNDLINQLVRTAIDLKRQTSFVEGIADIASETEILGSILACYLENSGRKVAETAYAALEEAGLTVEALAFSELWRRSKPDETDLWSTRDGDRYGGRNEN